MIPAASAVTSSERRPTTSESAAVSSTTGSSFAPLTKYAEPTSATTRNALSLIHFDITLPPLLNCRPGYPCAGHRRLVHHAARPRDSRALRYLPRVSPE